MRSQLITVVVAVILVIGFLTFLVGGGLMTLSFLTNFKIKSSLHTSLNCYLAACVFQIDSVVGIILFVMTLVVAWSRIILKRHTLSEVVMGFLVGAIASVVLIHLTNPSDFDLP